MRECGESKENILFSSVFLWGKMCFKYLWEEGFVSDVTMYVDHAFFNLNKFGFQQYMVRSSLFSYPLSKTPIKGMYSKTCL